MTLSWLATAWLVPLYPLVGAAFSLLWSPGLIKRTGPRPSGYINLLMVAMAFGHSLLALISLHNNSAAGAAAVYAPPTFGWTWIQTAGLRIGFDGLVGADLFDRLSRNGLGLAPLLWRPQFL